MPSTGSTCQTSGIYQGDCTASADHKKQIALSKGETFPPCGTCNRAVTWTLIRETK